MKSKEELALFNMALNSRVLLRSDSYKNTKNVVVDMAPINMSAGVIDFKIQYKKQPKRFNPTKSASNYPTSIKKLQSKSQ
jgi:hypothetical protein